LRELYWGWLWNRERVYLISESAFPFVATTESR
jgi:hypothetical protein